jgi:Lar family restriction alleviation protein
MSAPESNGPLSNDRAMDELSECPCCGSDSHIVPHIVGKSVRFKVVCEHCELTVPTYSAEADAVAAWNRRAPAADIPTNPPIGHWETLEGESLAREYVAKSRADLCKGELSDFNLANQQYLAGRADHDLVVWQTAAKERIRWLSAQLALAPRAAGRAERQAEVVAWLREAGNDYDASDYEQGLILNALLHCADVIERGQRKDQQP